MVDLPEDVIVFWTTGERPTDPDAAAECFLRALEEERTLDAAYGPQVMADCPPTDDDDERPAVEPEPPAVETEPPDVEPDSAS